MLVDTGNASVIRGPKCHFLENQDNGGRHSGKYTKGLISANSRSICTKFCMLVDIGNVGVQNSTFLEIQDSRGRRFGITQKGISWPILDKFSPNLCADKYVEYKSHKRPIIALFVNAAFLGI